jgi:hypothetical protein
VDGWAFSFKRKKKREDGDQGGGASGLRPIELRPVSLLLSNVISQVCTKSAAGCNRRKTPKQFVRPTNVWTVAFGLNCVNDLVGSSSDAKEWEEPNPNPD